MLKKNQILNSLEKLYFIHNKYFKIKTLPTIMSIIYRNQTKKYTRKRKVNNSRHKYTIKKKVIGGRGGRCKNGTRISKKTNKCLNSKQKEAERKEETEKKEAERKAETEKKARETRKNVFGMIRDAFLENKKNDANNHENNVIINNHDEQENNVIINNHDEDENNVIINNHDEDENNVIINNHDEDENNVINNNHDTEKKRQNRQQTPKGIELTETNNSARAKADNRKIALQVKKADNETLNIGTEYIPLKTQDNISVQSFKDLKKKKYIKVEVEYIDKILLILPNSSLIEKNSFFVALSELFTGTKYAHTSIKNEYDKYLKNIKEDYLKNLQNEYLHDEHQPEKNKIKIYLDVILASLCFECNIVFLYKQRDTNYFIIYNFNNNPLHKGVNFDKNRNIYYLTYSDRKSNNGHYNVMTVKRKDRRIIEEINGNNFLGSMNKGAYFTVKWNDNTLSIEKWLDLVGIINLKNTTVDRDNGILVDYLKNLKEKIKLYQNELNEIELITEKQFDKMIITGNVDDNFNVIYDANIIKSLNDAADKVTAYNNFLSENKSNDTEWKQMSWDEVKLNNDYGLSLYLEILSVHIDNAIKYSQLHEVNKIIEVIDLDKFDDNLTKFKVEWKKDPPVTTIEPWKTLLDTYVDGTEELLMCNFVAKNKDDNGKLKLGSLNFLKKISQKQFEEHPEYERINYGSELEEEDRIRGRKIKERKNLTGQKITSISSLNLSKKGGCYCFMPYDTVDAKNNTVFKIGMTHNFESRQDGYHTYFYQGVFNIAFLSEPDIKKWINLWDKNKKITYKSKSYDKKSVMSSIWGKNGNLNQANVNEIIIEGGNSSNEKATRKQNATIKEKINDTKKKKDAITAAKNLEKVAWKNVKKIWFDNLEQMVPENENKTNFVYKKDVDKFFKTITNNANGNCLFESLVFAVEGNVDKKIMIEKAGELRTKTCEYLKNILKIKNKNSLEREAIMILHEKSEAGGSELVKRVVDFVYMGEFFQVCDNFAWAEVREVMIAAILLKRNITVFTSKSKDRNKYHVERFEFDKTSEMIFILFNKVDASLYTTSSSEEHNKFEPNHFQFLEKREYVKIGKEKKEKEEKEEKEINYDEFQDNIYENNVDIKNRKDESTLLKTLKKVFYEEIEKFLLTYVENYKGIRIHSTTRVRNKDEITNRGATEWVYCDEELIHQAFTEAHKKYGGDLRLFYLKGIDHRTGSEIKDINVLAEERLNRFPNFTGKIITEVE
jgi:hypothetical protein